MSRHTNLRVVSLTPRQREVVRLIRLKICATMAAMLRVRLSGRRAKRWAILAVASFVVLSVTTAFFDEVLALKAELAQWEAVHADADFSDVLAQLDDIAGSVFGGPIVWSRVLRAGDVIRSRHGFSEGESLPRWEG